jgi:hypothetical protein
LQALVVDTDRAVVAVVVAAAFDAAARVVVAVTGQPVAIGVAIALHARIEIAALDFNLLTFAEKGTAVFRAITPRAVAAHTVVGFGRAIDV